MLHAIHALHYRAVCDGCAKGTRVVCGNALSGARQEIVQKLLAQGWRHEIVPLPGDGELQRSLAEQHGSGKWFCPACAAGHSGSG